jgi:hypothetical protein
LSFAEATAIVTATDYRREHRETNGNDKFPGNDRTTATAARFDEPEPAATDSKPKPKQKLEAPIRILAFPGCALNFQADQAHQFQGVAFGYYTIAEFVIEAHFSFLDVILKMYVVHGVGQYLRDFC